MGICNCTSNGQIILSNELKVPGIKDEVMTPIRNLNTNHNSNEANNKLLVGSPLRKPSAKSEQAEVDNLIANNDSKKVSNRNTLLMKFTMEASCHSQSTIEQYSRAQTSQSPGICLNIKESLVNSSKPSLIKEDSKLYYYLKTHFLFYHFPSDLLKAFCLEIKTFNYQKEQHIQFQDYFIFIKSGQIEIKENEKTILLSIGDSLGETAIVKENTKMKDNLLFPPPYSAIALTNAEVFHISYEEYQSLRIKNSNTQMNILLNNSIEDKIDLLNKLYLFDCVDPRLKILFASMIFTSKFSMKTIFYSKRKRFKIGHDSELRSQKLIFIIKKGLISIHAMDYTQIFEEGNTIGIDQMLFFPNSKTEYEFHPKNDCECYIIPEKIFIETFGLEYRETLMQNYFDYIIKRSEPIKKMLKGEKANSLFKAFTIKQYKDNEVVVPRTAFNSNTKYVLVLDGELINSKIKNKLIISKGSIYGDDRLYMTEE